MFAKFKVHRRELLRRVPHCGSVDVEAHSANFEVGSGSIETVPKTRDAALASARTRVRRGAPNRHGVNLFPVVGDGSIHSLHGTSAFTRNTVSSRF